MSKNEQAAAFLRSVVHNHVGSNIRSYTWKTWCCELSHNSLGDTIRYRSTGFIRPATAQPVKQAIHRAQGAADGSTGDRRESWVEVLPTSSRFDGTLADGSEDAVDGEFRTIMLSRGRRSYFPVKWDGRYIHQREP